MALMKSPICDFGQAAIDFCLPDVEGKLWRLEDCCGEKGMLIMFICNHCPYVKAIQTRMVEDVNALLAHGIKSVAIMPNDPTDYPEDSLENMAKVAKTFSYPFPYLYDQTQATARAYDAVCTPDFFGYNQALELQYRGRLDEAKDTLTDNAQHELLAAMIQVAKTGQGPSEQIPSMGCSIKWQTT